MDRRQLLAGTSAAALAAAVLGTGASVATAAPGAALPRAKATPRWGTQMGLAIPMYHFTWGYEAKLAQTMQLIKDSGTGYVRTDAILDGLSWSGQTGIWWPYLDPQIDALAAAGKKIIMCVQTMPSYARPAGTARTTGPRTPAERRHYVRLLKLLVNRYKSKVHYWEIWNEPNLVAFWSRPSVVDYGNLLREAHVAVKSVDPSAVVLSGGTGGASQPGDIKALDFLRGLYDRRMLISHCDQVAIHAYTHDNQIKASSSERVSLGEFAILGQYRKLMDSRGDATKPLAITEAGAHVSAGTKATEASQAELYPQAALAWSKLHHRGPITWFSLYNEQSDDCGLMRAGGKVKRPAFDQLAWMSSLPLDWKPPQ